MSESKRVLANLFLAFGDVINEMSDREFDLLVQAQGQTTGRPKQAIGNPTLVGPT